MRSLRALVLSTERSRGALSAVRSLRQSGWVVGVGTPRARGMLSSSRASSAAHLVPKPRGDARGFVSAVNRAIAVGGYDIVFGGADDWMAALSAYGGEIDAPVAHPDFSVVSTAMDKLELTGLARSVGLAAPETRLADAATMRTWRGPVVVKCRSHWTPGRMEDHRIEAKVFRDVVEAGPRVQFIRAAGEEPLLQEPVRGQLGAIIGVFHDGRLDARVQQVTAGLWPTPSGVSTRARTVPIDEPLVRLCERLLDGLGWRGLVELQFLTGADGVPRLIDLNGRFFGSMALTNVARPGVADMWGRLVLGESFDPLPDAAPGHRYSWAAGDLRRAAVERRGGLVSDVTTTLLWAASATDSVWSVRDPWPTARLIADRFTSTDGCDAEPPVRAPAETRLPQGHAA